MRLYQMLWLLAFSLGAMLGGSFNVAHVADEPSEESLVVAVEDKTVESNCKESINNGPEYPCAPGSIVWTKEMKYREVKAAGIKDFVVRTDNKEKDKQAVYKLAEKIFKEKKKQDEVILPMGCVAHINKTVSRQYTFSNGTLNQFEMQYSARNDCTVYAVADRAKTSGQGITWINSCTDYGDYNDQRCLGKNNLPLNAAYSPWYGELDSKLTKYYAQIVQSSPFNSAIGRYMFD